MAEAKTIAFHTLGCKLNYSETATLSRLVEEAGFEKKSFDSTADVYVINTCSVTENADKECRYLLRQIQRKSPESMVVITGCYAQLKPQEIAAIPGVDLVLGAAEKFNLVEHISQLVKGDATKICSCDIAEVQSFHDGFSYDERTRAFLKVQDGCDYSCSFCTIPLARGKSRSDTMDHVLKNVRELAARGIQEVVLTGVNLGDFGRAVPAAATTAPLTPVKISEIRSDGKISSSGISTESFQRNKVFDNPSGNANMDAPIKTEPENFSELTRALEQVTEIPRFRISSIEPNLLTDEIIERVAGSRRFMPHFHIPLQSGSNKILGMMRRRYRRELYAERVALIKKLMPHAAIGADVIVGFPGESEEDFKETFNFLHSLDVSYLHVFTYSERDQTRALEIKPVVPVSVRNERNKILRNLSFQKLRYFTAQHAGQTRKVLFEKSRSKGMMEGYTDNYIKVIASYREDWVNRIIDWKL
jgi:threonylcarbamoyladenosine tRNA methylthiotransferase MtaB